MGEPIIQVLTERCRSCEHGLQLICLMKGEPICEFFPVDTHLDEDSYCALMVRCELRIQYFLPGELECDQCPFGAGKDPAQLAVDCPVRFYLENGHIKQHRKVS